MRISTAVLATLVLSMHYPASAEQGQSQRAGKEWPQEPDAVLGIKLGHPVAESQLPTCIEPSASNGYTFPSALCLYPDRYNKGIRETGGLPWRNLRIRGDVFLFEGKVKSIHFDVAHGDFKEFSQMLVSKYGKPMQMKNGTVKSYGGAELSSASLEWVGENALISAYERYDKVDRSLVVFNDSKLMSASAESNSKKVKDGASHF